MTRFIRWSSKLHSTLRTNHPQLKLSHTKEIFAAALGHHSYASLRTHDLEVLNKPVRHSFPYRYEIGKSGLAEVMWYVPDDAARTSGLPYAKSILLDSDMALQRAVRLGLMITLSQWQEAVSKITNSGSSEESYIGTSSVMENVAKIAFNDSADPFFEQLGGPVGINDGHSANRAELVENVTTGMDLLRFRVYGEVRSFAEHNPIAYPVVAEIQFRRLGRQLYGDGKLVRVERNGPPEQYEPTFDIA